MRNIVEWINGFAFRFFTTFFAVTIVIPFFVLFSILYLIFWTFAGVDNNLNEINNHFK
jgi:hypothetical protein